MSYNNFQKMIAGDQLQAGIFQLKSIMKEERSFKRKSLSILRLYNIRKYQFQTKKESTFLIIIYSTMTLKRITLLVYRSVPKAILP